MPTIDPHEWKHLALIGGTITARFVREDKHPYFGPIAVLELFEGGFARVTACRWRRASLCKKAAKQRATARDTGTLRTGQLISSSRITLAECAD